MGYPIVLTGGNGTPFFEVEKALQSLFTIGTILNLREVVDFNGALPREIQKSFPLITQEYDIPICFTQCFSPSFLVYLNRATGPSLRVVYLELSIYKRFELALLKEQQRQEDFIEFERIDIYQQILKSRADVVFSLDEWFSLTGKSKLTLEEKLARKLATIGIQSSKVRNAKHHNYPSPPTS